MIQLGDVMQQYEIVCNSNLPSKAINKKEV